MFGERQDDVWKIARRAFKPYSARGVFISNENMAKNQFDNSTPSSRCGIGISLSCPVEGSLDTVDVVTEAQNEGEITTLLGTKRTLI